jgi:hypothetical protein
VKETAPLKLPAAAAVSWTLNVVDAPAATVVVPKAEARLNPEGRVTDPRVRDCPPTFLMVNVFVSAWPTRVDPNESLPPLPTTDVPSTTCACGGGGFTVP